RRLVFINAWNEWAEGAVLEPDTRLGHAWLEATRQALSLPAMRPAHAPCAVIHAWYLDVLAELLQSIVSTGITWRIVITTTEQKRTEIERIAATLGVQVEIQTFDNRGRDILPFLHVAEQLLEEGQ